MANVGNLFINVTGNTKGLTKALSSAKTKLATFDKQVGRPRGDFMRRARGRFQGAMAERQRFEATSSFVNRMSMRHGLDVPGMDKDAALRRARLGSKEKGARQAYRQAQREQVMGGMRRQVQMTLGIFGVSIAGASMLFNKAMSIAQETRKGVDQFRFLGPQGSEILKSEVAKMINQVNAATGSGYSGSRAILARTQEAAEKRAIETGQLGYLNRVEALYVAASSSAGESAMNQYGGSGVAAAIESNYFPVIAAAKYAYRTFMTYGGY
jgi:hypothetical protein